MTRPEFGLITANHIDLDQDAHMIASHMTGEGRQTSEREEGRRGKERRTLYWGVRPREWREEESKIWYWRIAKSTVGNRIRQRMPSSWRISVTWFIIHYSHYSLAMHFQTNGVGVYTTELAHSGELILSKVRDRAYVINNGVWIATVKGSAFNTSLR